jgi:hypothetical protein
LRKRLRGKVNFQARDKGAGGEPSISLRGALLALEKRETVGFLSLTLLEPVYPRALSSICRSRLSEEERQERK